METREFLCDNFLTICNQIDDVETRQQALREAMEVTPHGSCSNTFEHGMDAFAIYESMLDVLSGRLPHT